MDRNFQKVPQFKCLLASFFFDFVLLFPVWFSIDFFHVYMMLMGQLLSADVGRIGIGICYDLRFQELAAIYAARGLFAFLFLSYVNFEIVYFH